MTATDRAAVLSKIIASIQHLLHPTTIESLNSLLEAGEARVAAEILNEVLCDDEIRLPPEPTRRLHKFFDRLGIVPHIHFNEPAEHNAGDADPE